MHLSTLKIWNFRQFGETMADGTAELSGTAGLQLEFNPKLNVLIGQNDSGKTSIIDAIKFTLGTKSLDHLWLEYCDFHEDPTGRPSSIKLNVLLKALMAEKQSALLNG